MIDFLKKKKESELTTGQIGSSLEPVRCEIMMNGVKVVKMIPTRWAHVTFETWLKLRDCGTSQVKLFCILTGIEEAIIRKAKIFNLDAILAMLSFLQKAPDTTVPAKILGYEIPKDLGFESIGQYEDLHDDLRVQRSGDEQVKRFPLYCAIYACSAKHGYYDWKLAEEMASEFLQAPAGEVLAVGNFTLMKQIGLMKGIAPSSLNQAIHLKRLNQVSPAWRRLLDSTVRYFNLKKKRHSPATK